MYCVIMFLVPLSSLIVLNYKLMTTLRRTRRRRESWRSSRRSDDCCDNDRSRQSRSVENEITRMLIVVVIVFVSCQSPAFITQALPIIFFDLTFEPVCPISLFFYVRVSDLLVVANSSLNFVIYCVCSRRFRSTFTALVRCQATRRTSVSDWWRRQKENHVVKKTLFNFLYLEETWNNVHNFWCASPS